LIIVQGRKGKGCRAYPEKESSFTTTLALPDLAPPPDPKRVENPTPVADPAKSLEQTLTEADRLRRQFEPKCRKCKHPQSECDCLCTGGCGELLDQCVCCEDCGETPCSCEEEDEEAPEAEQPSILAWGARTLATEKGDKVAHRLLNGLGDILENAAERVLFGQQKKPAAAVAKVAAAVAEAAPQVGSVAPNSPIRIVSRMPLKEGEG